MRDLHLRTRSVVFLTVVPLLVLVSLVWPCLRDRLDWLIPVAALVGGISGVVATSKNEPEGRTSKAETKQEKPKPDQRSTTRHTMGSETKETG